MQLTLNKLSAPVSVLIHALILFVISYNPNIRIEDLSQPLELIDVYFDGDLESGLFRNNSLDGENIYVQSKASSSIFGSSKARENLRYQELISMKIGQNLEKVIDNINFSFDVKLALRIDSKGNIIEYRIITLGKDIRSEDLIDKIVTASSPLPKPPEHLHKALDHVFVVPIRYKRG